MRTLSPNMPQWSTLSHVDKILVACMPFIVHIFRFLFFDRGWIMNWFLSLLTGPLHRNHFLCCVSLNLLLIFAISKDDQLLVPASWSRWLLHPSVVHRWKERERSERRLGTTPSCTWFVNIFCCSNTGIRVCLVYLYYYYCHSNCICTGVPFLDCQRSLLHSLINSWIVLNHMSMSNLSFLVLFS